MAPMIDHRVEAVAGAPLLDARAPVRRLLDHPGTALFVGRWVPSATLQFLLYRSTPRVSRTLSVTGDPVDGVSPLGGGLWATHYSDPDHLGDLNFGWPTTGRWVGPMRALAYDQVLTEAQINEIIRRLATTL